MQGVDDLSDFKNDVLSVVNERQQVTYDELLEISNSRHVPEASLKEALKDLEEMHAIASRSSGGILTYYILQEEPNLRRIMIVEDDRNINKLMALSVGKEFDITQVYDGKEALDRIRREKPDLIILDLMLPGMDGLEICQNIKRDPNLSDTVVIIVSAMDATSNRFKGIKYGADYYIKKPFDPEELKDLVTIFLKKKGKRFDPLIDLPNEDKISDMVEKALQGSMEYEIGRLRVNGLADFARAFGTGAGMTILRLVSQLLQDKIKDTKGDAFVGFLNSDDFVIAGSKNNVERIVNEISEEFKAVLPFIYQSEGYKPIELGIEDIYGAEMPKLELEFKEISKESLSIKRAEILKSKPFKEIGAYTYDELRRMLGSDSIDITITRDPSGVKLSIGKSPHSNPSSEENEV